jgi:hypothetical protein
MTDDLSIDTLLATLKARREAGTPERKEWLARRKEVRAGMIRNGGISVNGRIHFFNRIKSVKRVPGSKSRWVVESTLGTFQIEGGRHAGGLRSDWFLDGFGSKPIHGKSLINLLRDIERA